MATSEQKKAYKNYLKNARRLGAKSVFPSPSSTDKSFITSGVYKKWLKPKLVRKKKILKKKKTKRTKKVEGGLRQAGLTESDIARFRSK